MTQHTPGPWSMSPSNLKEGNFFQVEAWHIEKQSWQRVANIAPALPDCDCSKIDQANARLIAAAPDMLEALLDIAAMAGLHEAPASFKPVWREVIAKAQAGINKAKGV